MPDPTGPDAAEAISRNPATGEVIAAHPFLSAEQVERALAANARAFAEWRSTAMAERVERYRRLASILRERSEHLAGLITAEMGKTIREARAEVEKSAVLLDWLAEHGPAVLADEPADTGGEDRAWVSFLPIGTVFAVMPWNLPIWQVIRASGPIMLGGNGFLLKHATNVIGCAEALEAAYAASGFPSGLFSSVNVDNAAAARIIADPRIAAVTLTGSVGAGSAVAQAAGKAVKKSLLELGGADAFIVLADADLDRAVAAAILSRFGNAGQVCLAAKRIIIERPVAEEFTRRFVQAARAVTAGDPLDPASTIGPIARGDLRDGIHDQVERSMAAGATLLLGGRKADGPGFFYEPTVLAEVTPGMAAFDEEIFGPVAAIVVADDAEHAVTLANASEYGLGGALWTADLAKGRALIRRLETGGVFLNGWFATNPRIPVGGIKKSGYGRELSHFGLREFTNAQAVWESHAS